MDPNTQNVLTQIAIQLSFAAYQADEVCDAIAIYPDEALLEALTILDEISAAAHARFGV